MSIVIALKTSTLPPLPVPTKSINWTRAIENRDIDYFAAEVSSLIRPFIDTSCQGIQELEWEITYVSRGIRDIAFNCLPLKRARKKKSIIRDDKLKARCKSNRTAWKKWHNAGSPVSGPLAEEKKPSKKCVHQFVATARARQERSKIQERDCMFKGNHPLRFKCARPKSDCSKLVVDDQSISNTSDILNHFRSFFGSLSQSHLSSNDEFSALSELENMSFSNNEQLLNTEICVEEVENALKTLKLGKSTGPDGLSPEHIVYGGKLLVLWLKKIINRIVSLEEVPNCLKKGIVVPVYKRQGKDPLLLNSYRGITLLSVLSKLLKITLLQ